MFSYLQIQLAIEKETDHLENLVTRYRDAAQNAATAESDFKLSKAQALLRARVEANGSRVSVDVYEATALLACEPQYRVYLTTGAILDAIQKEFRATEARLDALRTLAASHRAAGG
jgi:hypothetical protein